MKWGILIILVCLFVPIIMFLFWGDSYIPQGGIIYNIKSCDLVFRAGTKQKIHPDSFDDYLIDKGANDFEVFWENNERYRYKGRIAIPFQYIVGLSLIGLLIGIILLVNEKSFRS